MTMAKETVAVMIGDEVVNFNLSVDVVGGVYYVRINEKEILVGDGLVAHKVAHALYASIKDELEWPSIYKPADYVHEYGNLESIVDLNGVPVYDLSKYANILNYIERWS